MAISDFDLGWVVGILEGEGSFQYDWKTQRVCVDMSDEDTVRRLACLLSEILATPISVKPLKVDPRRSWALPLFRVIIFGDRARGVMRLIVKHMSWRRRRRIWQCLNRYYEVQKRAKPPGTWPWKKAA